MCFYWTKSLLMRHAQRIINRSLNDNSKRELIGSNCWRVEYAEIEDVGSGTLEEDSCNRKIQV